MVIGSLLCATLIAIGPLQERPPLVVRTLQFTHYLPTGARTYSGEWPATGTAACSWDLPIGTVIVLEQGHIFRCNDRGMLGSRGWLDAFVETSAEGRELAMTYGDRVRARVFLP